MKRNTYIKTLLQIIALALFVSCQSQNDALIKVKKSDWKEYGLSGKIKKLVEEYRPAQYSSVDDTIYMSLATIDPDQGVGKPFILKFNKKGYKTKLSYYDRQDIREYYFYKDDTILTERKKYGTEKQDTLIELIQYYNERGNITSLKYYDPMDWVMTEPNEIYTFEYDKFDNCEDIKAEYYYYKSDHVTVDEVQKTDFKFINTYENDLLASKQFATGDGFVLQFDANGEESDSNEGKYLEGKGPDNVERFAGDTEKFTYDSRGNVIRSDQISARGIKSHNEYTYYDSGTLKTAKYFDANNKLFWEERFDEKERKIYFNYKLKGREYHYKYTEFDKYGNWTLCEIRRGWEKDRIYYFIVRTYEYYPE